MSFSGTPLGQGRRLDHSSFLGKQPSNSAHPPTSYEFSAPALGSRSPPKPTSPTRHANDEENEPALVRFARLKQRESAETVASRPGGPKIITSPPKPEKWSVKDTSVNIATAFTQAASGDMNTSFNHNNSWASTSRSNLVIPRSTSVEYESTAPLAPNRRLAPPPDKLGRTTTTTRKPPSKSVSLLHVPDSEGEDNPRPNVRGKSPFEQGLSIAKHALGAAAFYVRQRSREPDQPSGEHPSVNGHTNGNESSYSYTEEEQAFQAAQKRIKRGRMSTDNKAYKPSQSDDEESEWSDDGKKRKSKKKGPHGGPLNSLPTVGPYKNRKTHKGSRGNLAVGDEGHDNEDNTQTIESQSQLRTSNPPNSNPPVSHGSASRISREPPELDPEDSMSRQGLDSIPEINEELVPVEPVEYVRQASQPRRGRSRTPAPIPSTQAGFSVGGLLGSIVHVVIKLCLWIFSCFLSVTSMSTFLFGQVFGTTYDIMLRRPVGWARSARPLLKYLVPSLILFTSWYFLRDASSLDAYIPTISIPTRAPSYQPPAFPPANIAELSERLLRIENALSGLSADTERTKVKTEDGARGYSDLLGRLSSLEGRLYTETKKVMDADARARDAVSKSINGVKQEVEVLHSQLLAQQRQRERDQHAPTDITDEDARAKLKALEDRVGGVEGGVKEALELGKKAISAIPTASTALGPGAAWWNKLSSGSGSKVLQIKSADGQDVSALITQLVDSAVSRINKDGIAKPDFALHSAGARVIPSLTSPAFEVRPQGLGSQIAGLFTGKGYFGFRPPITALHHEAHSGHCWPFAGEQGQLGVMLVAPAYVEEITIDHLAKEVAFDMRSAPRRMEVWGMVEGKDNIERVKEWEAGRAARRELGGQDEVDEIRYPTTLPKKPEYIRLANFTYDIHAPNNVQTFPVDPEIRDLHVDFGIVVLRVLDNWGRGEFTCLYRFRVHGQRMGEIPMPYSPEDP